MRNNGLCSRGNFSLHTVRRFPPLASIPLTPIIPAPTRPPGGGVVPVSWSDRYPQLLCFPCLRKNRGVGGMSKQNLLSAAWPISSVSPISAPRKNVGAPTFSRSFLPMPTLDSLSLQLHAHSFIFRITPIRFPSNTFHTLSPKTRVSPLRSHQRFQQSPSFAKKPPLCVPSQRTLRLCGESLFSLLVTRHSLSPPVTSLDTRTSALRVAAACSSGA